MNVKYGLIILFAATAILLGLAGCRLADVPAGNLEAVDGEMLDPPSVAVTRRLMDKVDKLDGEEVLLNLANDEEYAFVTSRLAMGTKTRVNSPWLFKGLEATRKKHLKRYGRASDVLETTPQGNKHSIIDIKLSEQERLVVSAVGSALKGTSYIYLDCVATNETNRYLTAYDFKDTFVPEKVDSTSEGNISAFVSNTSRGVPQLVFESVNADTLLIYVDEDGDFVVSYYYSGTDANIIYPVRMKVQAPMERAVLADDDDRVKICLGRNHDDCDYSIFTLHTTYDFEHKSFKHMFVPFKGYIDFGFPIMIDDFGIVDENVVTGPASKLEPIRNLNISLCLSSVGGIVTKRARSETQKFWNHPNTRVTTGYDRKGNPLALSRLEWDLTDTAHEANLLDFDKVAFGHCEVVDFFVEITVPLRDDKSASGTGEGDVERGLPGTAFIIPEDHFDGSPYKFKPVITDMDVEEGDHYVSVLGKDKNLQWQDVLYATKYQWSVDLTPPAPVQLYNKPLQESSVKEFEIYIDGIDIEKYSYQLDASIDGEFRAGSESNPIDKSIPIERDLYNRDFETAVYRLTVWGIDKAGNRQLDPTEYEWTIYADGIIDINDNGEIDETDPRIVEVRLVNKPAFFSDSDSIEVVVSSENIYYYYYQLDNGPMSSVMEIGRDGDRIEVSALAEGFHSLSVYGSPDGQLWQSIPTTINWHVDLTPPTAEWKVAISDDHVTPARNFVIEITGDGIVEYSYSFDRGEPIVQDVSKLIRLDGLSLGQHIISVRGKDRAGNWQPVSQATPYSWVVDPDANYIALRNIPRSITNDTQVNMQLINEQMISFKYALDSIVLGDELPLKNFMKMPKIEFAYSCLARDTLISMADGTVKTIPDVLEGDMVLTYRMNGGVVESAAIPVFDLVTGVEVIPMYRIVDRFGNSILCTQGHPFMMAGGILKMASQLKPGDLVMADFGVTELVYITTEMYNDTIYNLVLGEAENRSEWHNTGFVMAGNKFLIGDNSAQINQQNLADKKDPNELLSQLPEEMHVDYINHLLRKQAN
jgi:hypothetical protein